MRAMKSLLTAATVVAALTAMPVHAQQPGTQTLGGGEHGGGMPMMAMCRQMMGAGGGMGMGGMGMGGMGMGMPMMHGMPADPKDRAAMLEMHGDMMKAMGDVMMKHAQRMHRTKGTN